MWDLACFLRLLFPGKLLWHVSHWYSLWVLRCLVKIFSCEKHFWQNWHWYGFSLVWVLMCVFSTPRTAKDLWQYSHWYGFSLVWILMWFFRETCTEKHIWQYSHWYGFSLVWVLTWRCRLPRCAKVFWQYSHWNGFSLVCVLMCLCRLEMVEQVFWQYLHSYVFSSVWFLLGCFRSRFSRVCANPLYFNLCLLTCRFMRSKQYRYMSHMVQVYGFNSNIMSFYYVVTVYTFPHPRFEPGVWSLIMQQYHSCNLTFLTGIRHCVIISFRNHAFPSYFSLQIRRASTAELVRTVP